MWKSSTRVIEITGIMGAGYLPSMLKELQIQLGRDYVELLPDGSRQPVVAMYHVDNTAARKWNPAMRRHIKELMLLESNEVELQEFIKAVKLADDLFRENVEDWNDPVDLVFRRGGQLHSFKRTNREKWRTALLSSAEPPKIQVFLRADENTIAESFENNTEVRRVLDREPDVYSKTAQDAYEEQELWFEKVERLPGLITVIREDADKKVFVAKLIQQLRAPLGGFGCNLVEQMSVFISYSSQDDIFARRLHADLETKGIQCWLAPDDMAIGAKLWDSIDDAIRRHKRLLLVLSENSIRSDWVEDEVNKAFAEERRRNQTVLFPIRLDDAIMKTSEPWATRIRDQRHIGDFRNWKNDVEYSAGLERILRDLS
jgi:hypothetical protein